MAWLVTNMWIALGVVSVLGLLLGWSFRGAVLIGRTRRAQVERDVLKTELEQAQSEIEGLYKAQRDGVTAASGAGDEALRGELEARERKMGELTSELAKSKAALEQLTSGGVKGSSIAAGVTGAAVGAAVATGATRLDENLDEEEASLVWRNRHLESRVRHLETQISEMPEPAQSAPVAAVAAAGGAATDDAEVDDGKRAWQVGYLRQRVEGLENELADAPVAAAVAAPTAAESDVDESEELANLRWRNRSLERKIAYYEGGGETNAAADDISEANTSILSDIAPTEVGGSDSSETAAAVAAVGAAVAAGMDDGVEDELDLALADLDMEEDLPELANEPSAEELTAEDVIASEPEPVVAETEAVETKSIAFNQTDKPLALDAPIASQADDLTVIGGVGPKIEEVLNELGIFHYDQVAAWTPENIAWVDDHLSFSGRIARERWVEQAQVLVGEDD